MSQNVDIIINARDQATNVLKNVGNGLASVGQQALAFGLAQVGIAGLTAALDTAGKALLGYNAKMQQAAIGFETMLGSAEAAKVFLTDLSDMAAKTPFEFPQLRDAAQKFLAFGFAAKDVLPTLEAVGNAASGLGVGAAGIERAVIAIGQIRAKGKVQGDELLQLAELGIPAYQILADKLKLTGDQVAKIGDQGIAADVAIKALVEGMNERFPNMMKKQADSAIGMLSTIKDNAAMIFGGLGESAFNGFNSALQVTRDYTDKIVDQMRTGGIAGMIEAAFPPEWGQRIWTIGQQIGDLIDIAKQAGSGISSGLSPALGTIVDMGIGLTDTLIPALQTVVTFGTDNLPLLEGALAAVATAYVAMKWEMIAATAAAAAAEIQTIALTASYVAEALALGEVALAMGLISGPAGWAALAIGGTVAAIGYFASKSNVGDATNAADMYVGNFDQVGEAANAAAGKVERLTLAQARYYQQQSGVGGEFEDMASRKLAAMNDKGRYDLTKHTGAPLLTFNNEDKAAAKAARAAEALANKIDHIKDRIQNTFEDLNQKILEETSTAYQLGTTKIQNEIDKIQRTLIDEAAKLGVDTTDLQAKMAEYGQKMVEPVQRAWREAWTDLKNQAALGAASLTGDKKAQAAAEEQIALAALDKEREERLKKVQVDKNDNEAALAVTAWYENQKLIIKRDRLDKERQAEVDKFDNEITTNQLLVDLHEKTQDQVDKLNRDVLDKKIKYLEEELKKEVLTAEQKLAIRKDLANATAEKDATLVNKNEAIEKGLKDAYKSFGTELENWTNLANQAAISMRDSFQDFFFDAMTGKLKSLGDYFKSFFNGVAKAISQMMANMAAKAVMNWIGIKFNAVGGRRSYGDTFVAGENGPELIKLDGAGAQISDAQTSAARMSGSGATAITVNVINNTGQDVKAQASEPKFDGQRYVVDVWIDAFARNVGGLRTIATGGTR